MKIGLTGDTHNNLKNVTNICDIFNSWDLDFVIHTGDISLPKTLYAFDLLNAPLKGVFGNNDESEKDDLLKVCKQKDFLFQDMLEIQISEDTHIFNPGECAGIMKGMNKVGIVDTNIPSMEIISF